MLIADGAPSTPREFFADLFSKPAYQPYDFTAAQVLDADELSPRVNRDPFDARICAAARGGRRHVHANFRADQLTGPAQ